ncbi:hypothetical protein [Halobacillus massiliensis]|uniref:hypothetical protein n=1 Tax=Halobacillus massiliensis TaxID=1926286 RepID=UPI0009E62958|nr:hypothetical protein [Halobacillus massiliensis]
MELLPLIKNAGFTEALFMDSVGNECSLLLKNVHSNEQFFHQLKIVPTRIEYYPLERKPYLYFFEKEKPTKVKLIKQVL